MPHSRRKPDFFDGDIARYANGWIVAVALIVLGVGLWLVGAGLTR